MVNFHYNGSNHPFSHNYRPMLKKAQFQTYAVFIYLLHGNAMLLS